jgi:predicted nucleic acid-binding protein
MMIAADTGFLVALFHKGDNANLDAQIKLQEFQDNRTPLITTSPVITELFHILKNRENLHHAGIQTVMSNIQDFNIQIRHPEKEDHVFAGWVKYIHLPDKKVDYTDFHLFVTGLEFGCNAIVTTDSIDHFILNRTLPNLVRSQKLSLPNLATSAYKEENIIVLERI